MGKNYDARGGLPSDWEEGGKFLHRVTGKEMRALEAEAAKKGIVKDVAAKLLDGVVVVIEKVNGGNVEVREQKTGKRRKLGIGAIEKIITPPPPAQGKGTN